MTIVASGSLSLRAPAKLNLGLRLLGLRDDGYHLLESIFAPIELCDVLEIEVLDGSHQIELEVGQIEDAALPPELAAVSADPDNLAFRAAEAFCAETGFKGRIRIGLKKAIPAAAGLGGGSSDAAAVLNGLAALSGQPVDAARLERLATGLGADVPFFLQPQPALVSGVGDIVRPVDGLPSSPVVLANPGISLATAEVYRAADALRGALTESRPGSTMRAFSGLCSGNGSRSPRSSQQWKALLINDLEPAARRLCPPVGRLLSAVRESGAVEAGMTGSGATIFGVFDSEAAARKAAGQLRESVGDSDPTWIRVSRLIGQD